jgi:hypothetical protein
MGTQTPPELESANYFYDGDGNMVKSVVNEVTTYYVGSYYEKVVDGELVTERKYYFAGSSTIAMREVEGETDSLYWLLSDHLNSTSITADAGGQILSEVRYTAFGEIRYENNTTPTDRLYTGQRADSYINNHLALA